MKKRIGKVQQKMLILLQAGIGLGLTRSFNKQLKILSEIPKEFARIQIQGLEYGLHRLYEEKYIRLKDMGNGRYQPYLTKEGRAVASLYTLEEKTIPPPNIWDKKWRVVFFDIPEKRRKSRDAFRYHLKRLGFKEIQKSAFCHPFPCGKEVLQIAQFYKLESFIHYLVASEISNESELRAKFTL